MASGPTVLLLCAGVTLLLGRVLGDDGFNLEDALDDTTLRPTPAKPRNPSGGADTGDFDLKDLLDFDTPTDKQTTTKPPRSMTTTKAPKKGGDNDDLGWLDLLQTTKSPHKTTKAPKTTKKTPKKDTSDPGLDFDLADALDDNNDHGKKGQGNSDHPRNPRPKGNKPKPGSSDISNQDLEDLVNDGDYSPDKKRSGKLHRGVCFSDVEQMAHRLPMTRIKSPCLKQQSLGSPVLWQPHCWGPCPATLPTKRRSCALRCKLRGASWSHSQRSRQQIMQIRSRSPC
ncbi:uncharacterized protein [Mobula birostris]|uniref:uncharacterized protein isoform X2 n=1 Tax=Mobula birostris TaxID=1983395 RepID=UPI003B286220